MKKMRTKAPIANMIFFPVVCLLLAAALFVIEYHVFNDPDAIMRTYIKNAKQGKTGYGCEGYYQNIISFAGLEPGDLVLGAYPDCAYGHYSHVGIYMGQGKVMEGFVDLGVNMQPLEHYRQYSEVCLLRVNAPKKLKEKVVESVKQYEGRIFYPLAFRPGDRIFNCTKIMWKAYLKEGINLDPVDDFWIPPDSFYHSPSVSIIRSN